MLDERTLKRKVLLRALGSPLTILPFMLGMTVMAAGWTFGWQGGYGWFAGLAGLLGAGGAFTTRLVMSGDKLAAQVASELSRDEQRRQEQSLDQLDHHLSVSDTDPRPETALRDLRQLSKALEQIQPGQSRVNISSIFDIQSKVGQLFEQCVRSLEQTAALWATAQNLNSDEARAPILEQRERIIADVQASIKHLSNTLVKLQSFGAADAPVDQLHRIREDLDYSLEIAKKVDARLSSFVKGAEISAQDQPLQFNQQRKGQ